MRSWVFRHRSRLRVLYGIAPASAPERSRDSKGRSSGLYPGEWRRTSRYVVLRPMRRKSA
jgi:hypothetical protein